MAYRGRMAEAQPVVSSIESYDRDRMPGWVRRALIWFFSGVIMLFVLRELIESLTGFLILLLVSLFLSFAMEPAVNRLEHMGVRRGLGTGLVFIAVTVASSLFGLLIGQVLATQITELVDQAPTIITDLEGRLQRTISEDISLASLQDRVLESGGIAEQLTGVAGDLVGFGTTIINLLFDLFTVFLFTFYLVAEGPRFRRMVCSFLPTERQRRVLQIWDLGVEKTGGYISSRVVLALISAVAHWVAFVIFGVPSPLPLALWMGLVSQFIPVVGLYIAAAVPLLIALINNPITALWVLLFVLVYQQIENYALQPRVTAQTMEIHPAVAFGSVLVGAALLGPVGALLALPASATIQGFLSTVVEKYSIDEEALAESRASRGAVEGAGDEDDEHERRLRKHLPPKHLDLGRDGLEGL